MLRFPRGAVGSGLWLLPLETCGWLIRISWLAATSLVGFALNLCHFPSVFVVLEFLRSVGGTDPLLSSSGYRYTSGSMSRSCGELCMNLLAGCKSSLTWLMLRWVTSSCILISPSVTLLFSCWIERLLVKDLCLVESGAHFLRAPTITYALW